MFRRPESLRERTLLRIIERQERTIEELTDRLMYMAGRPWGLPAPTRSELPDAPPREWTSSPAEASVY